MSALRLVLIVAALAVPLAACKKNSTPPAEQNVAVDINDVSPNDIEALPPDESSGTSSNELENGVDNSDVNALNGSANAN